MPAPFRENSLNSCKPVWDFLGVWCLEFGVSLGAWSFSGSWILALGAFPNPLVSARSIKTLRSFRARVRYGDIPCRAHHIAHDLPKQKITGGLYLIGTRLTEQSHLESAIHIQAKLGESNRPR